MRVFTAIAFLLFALFEIGSAIGYATLLSDEARIVDRAAFQDVAVDEIRQRLILQIVIPAGVGLALLVPLVALLRRWSRAATVVGIASSLLIAQALFQGARPMMHRLTSDQAVSEYLLAVLFFAFGAVLMGAGRTAARIKPRARKGDTTIGEGAAVQVVEATSESASASEVESAAGAVADSR